MIERENQAVIESGFRERDIELRVADMGRSQLEKDFADVVISNCVINLCPDKDAVYEEAFRILRPVDGLLFRILS
jgi:SAM-dependent methyltransferase